jgi:hypothetical protein
MTIVDYVPFVERMISRWAIIGAANECWPYTGHCFVKSKGGRMTYGRVELNKQRLRVHRAVWMIVHGDIPDGLCVLHSCDNPLCCNPSHLFLGTQADNIRDKMEKGRHRVVYGEDCGSSKITMEIAQQIREIKGTQRAIAARFGLSQGAVHAIRTGKTWK